MYGVLVAVVVGLLVGGTFLFRDRASNSGEDSALVAAEASSDASEGLKPANGTPPSNAGDPAQSGAMPSDSGEAGNEVRPLAVGDPIEPVREPPGETIAMFESDRMPADTRMQVEFQPYGLGPWGDESLVIRLTSVSPMGAEEPGFSSLEGMNVIVRVEPAAQEVVTSGGSYSGTLRAVAEQGVTVLSLVEARPIGQ